MTITPDQARNLLDGAEDGNPISLHLAAPDLAQTIAGMDEQWVVRFPATGKIRWCSDLEDARLTANRWNGTVVRRFVTAPEVAEP